MPEITIKTPVKSSPEKFYVFFKNHMSDLVPLYPQRIKTVDVISGEDGTVGCVKLWKYVMNDADGGSNPKKIELKAEDINDHEKTVTYKATGGDIMKDYKKFQFKIAPVNGFVTWAITYANAPGRGKNPNDGAALAFKGTETVDCHLQHQA